MMDCAVVSYLRKELSGSTGLYLFLELYMAQCFVIVYLRRLHVLICTEVVISFCFEFNRQYYDQQIIVFCKVMC